MAGTKISELPVATTLTGAELVPVVQSGATKQTTLAQMPYVPDGTGAVTTTVQAKLRETVSVKDFGAVADGVTNDSAAFAAARTAAAALGRKVYAPAGHYKLNTALTSSEDLILEGDGPGTILDFTGTVTGGSYALDANGTATQIEELSGTQNVGSMTVTFVSAPSLSVGDVFVIYNPTASSWSGFRTDYRAGEWCEVESISGSTVTLRNPLYDTYAAANVDVYKITGPEVVLRNFSIRGTTVLGLIKASLCIAPLAENITADHTNNSVIYWDRCFKPTVNNPNIRNIGDGGDDYGIAIGNSQHSRITGGYMYSRRHAVTHGGGSDICSVPVRDSRIIGAVLKNNINSGVESADFHGNTEDSSFIDCTIYNGANLQGKNNEYVNCEITNALAGFCIYHAEVKGGRLGARGCTFSTFVDPSSTGGRAIYDIGTGNNAITSNTTEDVTFFVENCNVRGRNLSSSTYFARMRLAGATVKTNIEIDGVTADVNALAGVLFTSVGSGTASSDFIIVDRISNFPSGTILHNSTGSAYTNFPHRCQKQTGKVSLTATSGTAYTLASAITFKYQYPREPVGHATTGGSTALLYNGNRAVWASLYQIRSNDVRPFIESGDATNWTATATVTVNWTACIDEV